MVARSSVQSNGTNCQNPEDDGCGLTTGFTVEFGPSEPIRATRPMGGASPELSGLDSLEARPKPAPFAPPRAALQRAVARDRLAEDQRVDVVRAFVRAHGLE